MYRSATCGELRISDVGKEVVLAGWVQRSRDLGGMTFVDLRDRYGLTQLAFNMDTNAALCEEARKWGREFVVQVEGKVVERYSKNTNMLTGEIEIEATGCKVLNASLTPPFTIEDESDGGDDLRMQWRFLDLRRNPLKQNLMLRHKLGIETRKYLDSLEFLEIETPYLIKSTPEGARDFVVPSRMNPGQFYALPQSPQTFKQLLMVSGYDRYYQIVRCFRDEDLRADRQPEFTQIDCEMAFVEQEDILNTFEGLIRHLFKAVKSVDIPEVPRMLYSEAMRLYGSDKPDIRFGMTFKDLTDLGQGKGFGVFDSAQAVLAINVPGCASYTRAQLDELTEWMKRPQIGAKGLIYVRCNEDGSFKSSVDKFFDGEALASWGERCETKPGDLILVLSGDLNTTRKQLNELRLLMGGRLGLRNPEVFAPLWVMDFPLLEFNEEEGRYFAMHHPFTSPKPDQIHLLDTDPGAVNANAYDFVLNGVEIGGGSIRIHDRNVQARMFDLLGFTKEEAQAQFGFLLNAFEYGAPPHGGLAFGFDRLCSLFGGSEGIRDFIAFPKNNSGRDVMIDAPSTISDDQLNELSIVAKKLEN
ncbi:MAG: aspartate--tRNA ligase [Flavobacteriales bacterium]|jgi:aspartyl-tRNA synthetase|nr:aspartate--tRNA ligase [Flavobacteriales bacterium]MDP4716839.1 aspartate--tRNA ligase [Flavobacteriales bacterium]MDP4731725.1 aspartate--tRNA ligase [Flavobacteriales bacterium]MDP4819351.1 aspartate--tRNA ligase [Flavobacteriales bacterium]MDP4951655.1 aspartate--tRNA ligase [Flavobacteriales bacterium]